MILTVLLVLTSNSLVVDRLEAPRVALVDGGVVVVEDAASLSVLVEVPLAAIEDDVLGPLSILVEVSPAAVEVEMVVFVYMLVGLGTAELVLAKLVEGKEDCSFELVVVDTNVILLGTTTLVLVSI